MEASEDNGSVSTPHCSVTSLASLQDPNMEEDETSAVDKRLEFFEEYVLSTLKLKSDRWQKCLAVEDQRTVIQDFLDKADHTSLVVSVNASGQLVPTPGFVGSSKNKAVYFIKQSQVTLSPDNIKTSLIHGDMSSSPLEQFSAFVEEVTGANRRARYALYVNAAHRTPLCGAQ